MRAEKDDGSNSFDCVKVFVSAKAIGWEWFIIEEDAGHGNFYGFAQSPLCHEGEFGDIAKSDLESVGAFSEAPENCMSPAGWRWKQ